MHPTDQAIVDQAIAYIDTADPADLAAVLAQTDFHDHLKADPAALRANLANDSHPNITRTRAARTILAAADSPRDIPASEPVPAHLAPLPGAQLSAAQADLVMTVLAGFQPSSSHMAADMGALKDQLQAAIDAFDAAHADD